MARIAGVNIPTQKRVEIGLTYIHGVGPHTARKIVTQLGIDPTRRISDLTESETIQIREIIDRDFLVEGDLRRDVAMNIKRLMDLGRQKPRRRQAAARAAGSAPAAGPPARSRGFH